MPIINFDIEHVSNGVDANSFCPKGRFLARELLGLPHGEIVLLFAADAIKVRSTGFDVLIDVLNELDPMPDIALAPLGRVEEKLTSPFPLIELGQSSNEQYLSFVYSSADVFVLPTRSDNPPNVVSEAMACGSQWLAFGSADCPIWFRTARQDFLLQRKISAS